MRDPSDPLPPSRYWARNRRLIGGLLVLWALATFLVPYMAPHLRFKLVGWPFGFWMAAQGSLLVYLVIVACYGWAMNRRDARTVAATEVASE